MPEEGNKTIRHEEFWILFSFIIDKKTMSGKK